MTPLGLLVGTIALVSSLAAGGSIAAAIPSQVVAVWSGAAPTPMPPPTEEPAMEVTPPPVPSKPLYGLTTEEREVVLTFDDGPSRYTAQILAILQAAEIEAAFFWVGTEFPLAAEVTAQGHQLGSHTLTHARLTTLEDDGLLAELDGSKIALEDASEGSVYHFRPPFGAYNAETLEAAAALGMRTVLWNVDSRDWALADQPEQILVNVLGAVKPGSIILLHERKQTVAVLPRLIESLKAAGYSFRLLPTESGQTGAQ